MTLHIRTPLLQSLPISSRLNKSVWLKMEALQPSGSFKVRGIGRACTAHAQRGATRFVSSSGGNAGIAVAYCGRMLQVPVTVVVPETTSVRARELIKMEGAELVVHGHSWAEANEFAQSLLGDGATFIHPFDDPLLWSGHSTMIDEVADLDVKPDAVVLSVGGGGLLCGVLEGLHKYGWTDVPVIAAETQGMASYARSLAAKAVVELEAVTGIATSLGARRCAERAVQWSQSHPISSVVVSDRQAVEASLRFLADHRVLVEPACGAALAALEAGSPILNSASNVLVIVCGGAVSTIEQLQDWQRSLA